MVGSAGFSVRHKVAHSTLTLNSKSFAKAKDSRNTYTFLTANDARRRQHVACSISNFIVGGMKGTSALESLRSCRRPKCVLPIQRQSSPRSSAMARAEAASIANFTTHLKHEPVSLKPATCFLLCIIDGTRTQGDLKEGLAEQSRVGQLIFYKNDNPTPTPEAVLPFV